MGSDLEQVSEKTSLAGLFSRAFRAPLSPELARWLLEAKLPGEDIEEVNALLGKNREGRLSEADQARLATYIEFDDALGALKSQARQALRGGTQNGS